MPPIQPPTQTLTGRYGHAGIALLTVIPEEFEAVKRILGTPSRVRNVENNETGYFCRSEEVASREFGVVVARCPARTNSQAMQATRDLLEHFRPSVVMLVGIGGGLHRRDGVEVGDVVVADYIDYMEFVKIDSRGVHLRHLPLDQPSVDLRMEVVEPLTQDPSWVDDVRMSHPAGRQPKAVVGMIVAGEKILSGPGNLIQRDLLRPFDKAIAVDMESKGVAEAICSARRSVWYNPRYLVVRGISDMIEEVGSEEAGADNSSAGDNSEEREKFKSYAAHVAAVFSRRIVADLLPRIYEL